MGEAPQLDASVHKKTSKERKGEEDKERSQHSQGKHEGNAADNYRTTERNVSGRIGKVRVDSPTTDRLRRASSGGFLQNGRCHRLPAASRGQSLPNSSFAERTKTEAHGDTSAQTGAIQLGNLTVVLDLVGGRERGEVLGILCNKRPASLQQQTRLRWCNHPED